MTKLRTVIADDEPLAVRRLLLAARRIEQIDVVGIAKDGITALDLIRTRLPDLLLVDIEMPGLNGLRLVEAIDLPSPPAVIFVTAHDQFAVEAFNEGAIDYVLKPVGEGRLRRAVGRARTWLRTRNADQRISELRQIIAELTREAENRKETPYDKDLWISNRGTVVRVPLQDVAWFEAAGDYVVVHSNSQEHVMYDSLRGLEGRLDPAIFHRVHRRAIVRLGAVSELERLKFGDIRLRLTNGDVVSVSRTYRKTVQTRLLAR